jgi:peroxiredoxin Q/BCP
MNGREVLAEVKQDPNLRRIPVVVMTSSDDEKDVLAAYNLYVNCYITKPVDLDQFIGVVKSIEHFWFSIVTLPAALPVGRPPPQPEPVPDLPSFRSLPRVGTEADEQDDDRARAGARGRTESGFGSHHLFRRNAMFSPAVRLSALGLALGLLAASGAADDKKVELRVGDPAPAFQALNDQDKTWSSTDHYGKKWVVIYFYPGDFTPGCTAQAKAFKEGMNKLTELGVEVVGVSGDSVKNHELFKKAQKLNFTLLADEDGALARAFGVPFGPGGVVKAKDADGNPIEIKRAGTAARWTFVVGKDGKVAYKNTKVLPAADAKAIIEFVSKAEGK